MKATQRTSLIRNRELMLRCVCLFGVGVGFPLSVDPVLAQSVVSSPSPTPATPAAVQEQQNSNPMQVFAPSEGAPPLPLQLGPVSL
ncbi:MAG TPA: hypothetical protein VFY06_04580, partial [Verrucomicrobiae bacterium]|nr:hypothetical protein [Verrucomicrobiae bacterium]